MQDESGCYRIGMWVRDSAAGLGTLTFYDPQTGCFGGLGHAVCDVDAGEPVPLLSGEIVFAEVLGVQKAAPGSPGELRGALDENRPLGTLTQNGDTGVYGRWQAPPPAGERVAVAHAQEVKPGPAELLCCVSGEVRRYECEIEKIRYDETATRNMVVRVTDPALLAAAGGIVQGMSGSPLLQQGKLVGAVTHVFLNDPQKGYAIFADTMLQTARKTAETTQKKAG